MRWSGICHYAAQFDLELASVAQAGPEIFLHLLLGTWGHRLVSPFPLVADFKRAQFTLLSSRGTQEKGKKLRPSDRQTDCGLHYALLGRTTRSEQGQAGKGCSLQFSSGFEISA